MELERHNLLPGDSVIVPDGRKGRLLNFRVEINRAAVQFLNEQRKMYEIEGFNLDELKPVL